MRDPIVCTEYQSAHEKGVQQGMKVGEDVAQGHHLHTQPSAQNHRVAERVADCNVSVIGHRSQEEVFHGCKANEEISLS